MSETKNVVKIDEDRSIINQGKVIKTDNRDTLTTVLSISPPDIRKTPHIEVQVNPVDLFRNMIENHPGYDDEVKYKFEELLGTLDVKMDEVLNNGK